MGGVGCGTVIDHVEVYKSRDDAFQFFGGTVNATHLVAIDALDDLFDFEFGYQGHIQFALGLADTSRADISQSNGIESDNDNTSPYAAIPQTLPALSNFTIIGIPDSLASVSVKGPSIPPSGSYGRAAHIRRNSGIIISNSVFMGFRWGISLDGSASQGNMLTAPLVSCFENNLVQAFVISYRTENASGAWMPGISNTGYISYASNDDIRLIDPFVRETYNFIMLSYASPALRSSFHTSCFSGGCCNSGFTNTSGYIGAFANGDNPNWAQDIIYGGWVRYRQPALEIQ